MDAVSGTGSMIAASFSTDAAKCSDALLSLEKAVSAEISTASSAKRRVRDCYFLLVCTSAHAHMFLGDVKP